MHIVFLYYCGEGNYHTPPYRYYHTPPYRYYHTPPYRYGLHHIDTGQHIFCKYSVAFAHVIFLRHSHTTILKKFNRLSTKGHKRDHFILVAKVRFPTDNFVYSNHLCSVNNILM